jgi:hypothetical protein
MTWEEACQILEIAPTASADEIRAQYIYRAQVLHPDKNANSPLNVRQKAEEDLKKVNVAYDFLKDPRNRPNNSPPKLNISTTHIRFNLDLNQKKSTVIRIENAGGPFTKFWMDDSPAPWLRVSEVKSLTNDPLPMEVTLEATGIEIPNGQSVSFLPVRVENEPANTKFETNLKIELRVKPAAVKQDAALRTKKGPNWLKTLVVVAAFGGIGMGASLYLGFFIPLWIALGCSLILSVQTWHYDSIIKYKYLGILYRLFLNLSMLSITGILIWSGIKLFSRQLAQTPIIGSVYFFAEFFVFVWLWVVVSRNSKRWPSMKLTVAFLIFAFFVLAFAGVSPLMEYKDNFFALFKQ